MDDVEQPAARFFVEARSLSWRQRLRCRRSRPDVLVVDGVRVEAPRGCRLNARGRCTTLYIDGENMTLDGPLVVSEIVLPAGSFAATGQDVLFREGRELPAGGTRFAEREARDA